MEFTDSNWPPKWIRICREIYSGAHPAVRRSVDLVALAHRRAALEATGGPRLRGGDPHSALDAAQLDPARKSVGAFLEPLVSESLFPCGHGAALSRRPVSLRRHPAFLANPLADHRARAGHGRHYRPDFSARSLGPAGPPKVRRAPAPAGWTGVR